MSTNTPNSEENKKDPSELNEKDLNDVSGGMGIKHVPPPHGGKATTRHGGVTQQHTGGTPADPNHNEPTDHGGPGSHQPDRGIPIDKNTSR